MKPVNETFGEVLSRRIARRSFLKGALVVAPLLGLWPDGQTPPRPSVIVVRKSDPGSPVIGT